jgi:hypothetical protein
VVTVDGQGVASIVGPGLATIKGSFGGIDAYATFVVADPAQPLPPQNLSNRVAVTASGLQLNRNTGFFVQTVTVTNISGEVLPNPLLLTIDNLTAGVSLVGTAVGSTTSIAPVGGPYTSIALPGQRLQPGQRVTLQLQFLNPQRRTISWQHRLFWTDAQP